MQITAQLLAGAALCFSSASAKMERHSHRHLARSVASNIEKRDSVAYAALMYWGKQNGEEGACGLVHSDETPLVGLQTAKFGQEDACGKYVEIRNTANNKTVTAPIYDSCTGCVDSNDLVSSIATFEGLGGDLDEGILNVVWTFVDTPAKASPAAKVATKEIKPAAEKVIAQKQVEAPAKEACTTKDSPKAQVADDDCVEDDTPAAAKQPIATVQEEKPQLKAEPKPKEEEAPKAVETPEAKVALPKVQSKGAAQRVAEPTEDVPAPSAEGFKLTHKLKGQELLDFFHFETAVGDNEGFANWVQDGSLQYVNGDGNVVFATEDTPVVDSRKTTRAVSNEQFNKGLFISHIKHSPSTYGSWPSYWMVSQNAWPQGGEIDILEGVGSFTHNAASVHTSAGCSMPSGIISQTTSKFMLDGPQQTNCDALATDTQGCGLRDTTPNTFGPGLNNVGGAWVAVHISDDGIKIHQWVGDSAPADVKNNAPAPSTWGKPALLLPSSSCNISERFTDLQLVFSTNVCGTWPGDLWNKDVSYAGQMQSSAEATGVDSCYEWAHNHGKAWGDAYFEVASISIFS